MGSSRTQTERQLDRLAERIIWKSFSDEDCHYQLKNIMNKDHENHVEEKQILNYKYEAQDNSKTGKRCEGENEEELWGHNLLHLAVCFEKNETAKLLSDKYRELISTDNGKWPLNLTNYLGLTPFHIAVAQGNIELVKILMDRLKDKLIVLLKGKHNTSMDEEHIGKNKKPKFVSGKTATVDPVQNTASKPAQENAAKFGKRTRGTVFMGQLPLTVAVLSYINHTRHTEDEDSDTDQHCEIIELFLKDKDRSSIVTQKNYLGDTVLHSIMRFVNCFPSKQGKAKLILRFLDDLMKDHLTPTGRRAMYFKPNNDNQTALQLAAKYAQTELFRYLMTLEDAYHISQPHDDLYEIGRYDVTEIDQVILWRRGGLECCRYGSKSHSVAELMCSCRSLDAATNMITLDVFETVIHRKWFSYHLYFWSFFVFHLFNIVLMNIHIVAKGNEIAGRSFGPPNFVMVCKAYFLVVGLLYIYQEFGRFILAKQQLSFRAVHHNVIFRLCLLISGICLLVDSALNLAPTVQNNWFLVFALITSAWFMMFFIRSCPYFSVYIVLINEALFKAVLPFVVLTFLQLFVFSSCMHSFFLDLEPDALADPNKVSFETYGKAALTMGKLMVGLTEVENLLSSNQDVLAVIVFSLFALVTFLLMINALIGVMTNRFTATYANRVQITYLQKLSIIIFLEGWFVGPFAHLAKPVGEQDLEKYFKDNNDGSSNINGNDGAGNSTATEEEKHLSGRFVISYRRVASDQADQPSNIEHKLSRSHSLLKEINKNIEIILENHHQKHNGRKRLHIYHYAES